MIDKIYAIEICPYYLESLNPIRYTYDFKNARTYSTIGPAKAIRTKYLNKLKQCPKDKSAIYLGFPRIREFEVYKGKIIHLN